MAVDQETVGARIQRLAREQGKPAGKQLAEEIGVQYESLRQWTAGMTAPNRKRAQVIADYLGVRVDVVMHGTEALPRQIDAEEIADAFNALPTDTKQAIDRRAWLYDSIIGQIASQHAAAASAHVPQPGAQPSEQHPPAAKTQP